jgi:hypothetical protein
MVTIGICVFLQYSVIITISLVVAFAIFFCLMYVGLYMCRYISARDYKYMYVWLFVLAIPDVWLEIPNLQSTGTCIKCFASCCVRRTRQVC